MLQSACQGQRGGGLRRGLHAKASQGFRERSEVHGHDAGAVAAEEGQRREVAQMRVVAEEKVVP